MSDAKFLFDKIRKIYPKFEYPDILDEAAWEEVLEGFSHDDILNALKEYRKTEEYNSAPNPAQFARHLRDFSEPQIMREDVPQCSCPEHEVAKLVKARRNVPFGEVVFAFKKMVNDFIAHNPEAGWKHSNLYVSMRISGWWDRKVGEYL